MNDPRGVTVGPHHLRHFSGDHIKV
jgi:hypothetical protein